MKKFLIEIIILLLALVINVNAQIFPFAFHKPGNNEQTITQLGPGGDAFINGFLISSTDSNIVFMLTDNGGLYRSTNQGNSWERKFGLTSVQSQKPVNIVEDPTNANNILVGTMAGVYKSTDIGETWNLLTTEILSSYPYSQSTPEAHYNNFGAVNYSKWNSSVIYIGYSSNTRWRGENDYPYIGWKSTNGGTNWTALGTSGGPTLSSVTGVGSIDVGSSDGTKVLYATTQGLYVSTNSGSSWTQATASGTNADISANILRVKVIKNNTSLVYICRGTSSTSSSYNGFYKSTDGGYNFTKVTFPTSYRDQQCRDFSILDNAGQKIKVFIGMYIYMTTDGGTNWNKTTTDPVNPGWATYFGTQVGVSFYAGGTNGQILYAGNSSPVRSTDNGDTWEQIYSYDKGSGKYLNNGFVGITGGWDIFVDPDNHSNIIIGGYDQSFSVSKDDGSSWSNYFSLTNDTSKVSGHDGGSFTKDDLGNYFISTGGNDQYWAHYAIYKSTDLINFTYVKSFFNTYLSKLRAFTSGSTHRLFTCNIGAKAESGGAYASYWQTGLYYSDNQGSS